MSRTVGPIIAVGAITITNMTIFHGKPMDWRVPIATGITAAGFTLFEKAWEPAAVAFSYLALFAVLFVRLQPDVPSPAETAVDFLYGKG